MVDRQFWDDFKWGHAHHTELLLEHRDEWVAIMNQQVIAAGTNLAEVQKKAKEKTGTDEIPVLFIDCGARIYAS